jgi:ribosomal protein S18 acetylase RimI-like enzyme
MTRIFQAQTDAEIEAARVLFREYETWLDVDLCFQGFEKELAGLPGKYAPPAGRLFLATENEAVAGCVALRQVDEKISEMKRLFVREDFRGSGLGRKLIVRLIDEARNAGYERMRLDTLPERMPAALRLYEALGFREIEPYYDSPLGSTIFLELEL